MADPSLNEHQEDKVSIRRIIETQITGEHVEKFIDVDLGQRNRLKDVFLLPGSVKLL